MIQLDIPPLAGVRVVEGDVERPLLFKPQRVVFIPYGSTEDFVWKVKLGGMRGEARNWLLEHLQDMWRQYPALAHLAPERLNFGKDHHG